MKKYFTLTIFLVLMYWSLALAAPDSITLTTYYPAPFGSYDTLRLVPKASGQDYSTPPPCQTGSLYVNSSNELKFCDGTGAWVGFGGSSIWTKNSHDVFLNDTDDLVGIGTTEPELKLSLDNDGGIIAKGTLGVGADLATSGAGERLIWYPKKGAFRAGGLGGGSDAGYWDDFSIGDYSTAFGLSTRASGAYSFAVGNYSTADGPSSMAFGDSMAVSSGHSMGISLGTPPAFPGVWQLSQNNTLAIMGGNIGIGTVSPEFKLTLDNDGGILAKGTQGSGADLTTTSGAGTRLIWYPKKSAFRVGTVSGTQWDNANIGNYSTAIGSNTTASGINSTAIGTDVTVTGLGSYSTAIGKDTTASASYSIAMGTNTTASGSYSTAIGQPGTIASGSHSTAIGNGSIVNGNYSTAIGLNTTAPASYSTSMGINTTASGSYSTAIGQSGTISSGSHSTAIGNTAIASGMNSIAMGNTATASGDFSTAIGSSATASGMSSTAMGTFITAGTASNTMVLGRGVDSSNRLVNNIANSLMVGFGSTIPTLFVGPSSGAGTTGNVGIGTSTPGYKLTVNGTAWCTAGAWASDLRWKEKITTLNNPLEKLLRLRGVEFDWKRKEFKDKNFPQGRQIGIIAQELEKEFPELVLTDQNGYKAVAYDKFTVVLLEALKTQQEEIKGLKEELATIKSMLKEINR